MHILIVPSLTPILSNIILMPGEQHPLPWRLFQWSINGIPELHILTLVGFLVLLSEEVTMFILWVEIFLGWCLIYCLFVYRFSASQVCNIPSILEISIMALGATPRNGNHLLLICMLCYFHQKKRHDTRFVYIKLFPDVDSHTFLVLRGCPMINLVLS